MNFFSNRIVTSSALSLEEAARKAKEAPAVRSLDQILSDLDGQNKTVKTASAAAPVKTAKKDEEKTEEKAETKAEEKAEEKKPEAKTEDKKEEKAEDKKEEKAEEKKPEAKTEDKKEEKAEKKAEVKKVALKVASSLDFRNWEAQDVVKAWEQHGSFQKCCENVAGKANDPKAYCGLLQVASTEAGRIVKVAAKAKAEKKVASTQGRFQKLAKLSDKDRNLLAKYWTKLFGPAYVKAMLEDN